MSDAAVSIGPVRLSLLKKEYGGLNTLLRNHCQIFHGTPATVHFKYSFTLYIIHVHVQQLECIPCDMIPATQ